MKTTVLVYTNKIFCVMILSIFQKTNLVIFGYVLIILSDCYVIGKIKYYLLTCFQQINLR